MACSSTFIIHASSLEPGGGELLASVLVMVFSRSSTSSWPVGLPAGSGFASGPGWTVLVRIQSRTSSSHIRTMWSASVTGSSSGYVVVTRHTSLSSRETAIAEPTTLMLATYTTRLTVDADRYSLPSLRYPVSISLASSRSISSKRLMDSEFLWATSSRLVSAAAVNC